jgi:hypothetical protein
MRSKLLLGILGALTGAVLGAVAWAAITASANFQIGYMAVGVGILAGYGMRLLSAGSIAPTGSPPGSSRCWAACWGTSSPSSS